MHLGGPVRLQPSTGRLTPSRIRAAQIQAACSRVDRLSMVAGELEDFDLAPFSVASHVSEATAVLDKLPVGRAAWLGRSWDSRLALRVALGSRRERLRHNFLVDPCPGVRAAVSTRLAGRLAGGAPAIFPAASTYETPG